MIVSSSVPRRPPSPACGLSPETSMRSGFASGNHRPRASVKCRTVRSMCSRVTVDGTRLIGQWVATRATLSRGPRNIMVTFSTFTPARRARCSVWPRNDTPERLTASLLTGPVTIARAVPSMHASHAFSSASRCTPPPSMVGALACTMVSGQSATWTRPTSPAPGFSPRPVRFASTPRSHTAETRAPSRRHRHRRARDRSPKHRAKAAAVTTGPTPAGSPAEIASGRSIRVPSFYSRRHEPSRGC